MKFTRLVVKNILRNRRRTTLAAAGIGLAVFVVTAVTAVQVGFGSLANSGGESLLNVYEKNVACALSSRVFDTYLGGIRSIPSVVSATGVLKGMYTYQRKENLVAVEGVDYEAFRSIGDIHVQEGSEGDFVAAGDGALVGRRLAGRYNWRVGETVSMVEGLTFRVAGVFSSSNAVYERELLLHKTFLASLMRDDGKSTYLVVKVADAASVAPVSRSIDETFANYPRPTKTQPEKASREQQARDYDAIRVMLSGMVLATILASLFGAANSISMSVRERTREVGILRSLGFRRRHVLTILIGESLFIALVGGLVGLGASWVLLASEKMLGGVVPVVMTPPTAAFGLGMAVLIGLLGALVPAVMASRVKIVDTLRIVD